MNLLDIHAKKLKIIVKKYGRSVILTDPSGPTDYPLTAIWNDVEHVVKIETLEGDPMGARSVIYFDRDSLQLTGGGEIKPTAEWTAKGSPNAYDAEATYQVEIPKEDRQLPGMLLFLAPIDDDAERWPDVPQEA